MGNICLAFFGFLLAAVVLAVILTRISRLFAGMSSVERLAQTRKWLLKLIVISAVLGLGHYTWEGSSNITTLLTTTLIASTTAWAFLGLVQWLIGRNSKDPPDSQNRNKDVYY